VHQVTRVDYGSSIRASAERAAEQAHRDLPAKVEEAYRAAHRLACEEWSSLTSL
jgi:hypothetical protein